MSMDAIRFFADFKLIPFIVFFYVLSCWSFGSIVLYRWKYRGLVIPFVIGHAILGIILQTLALAAVYYRSVLIILFLIPIVIAAVLRLFSLPDWKKQWKNIQPEGISGWVFMLSAAACIVPVMVNTLSLPGTDALAYYMAQPKLIAANHSYSILEMYRTFAVLPIIGEIPYAAMYSLSGESYGWLAAKSSMFLVLLGILGMFWTIGRGLGLSRNSCWLLIAIGVSSNAITNVAWDGKTDLIGVMYFLAALYFMPGLLRDKTEDTVFASCFFGLMSGAALITKLSFILILPPVLGIPLVCLWWKSWKPFFRTVAIAGGAAFLFIALGWWFKNFFVFGDPFAPIFYLRATTPVFPTGQSWFSTENTRWILMQYPLALTFGRYPMQHGGISPVWLIVFPLILFLRRNDFANGNNKFLFLAAGGIGGIILWMIFRPSVIAPRYIMPALLTPLFLVAFIFDWIVNNKRVWSYGVLLGVAGICFSASRELSYFSVHFTQTLRQMCHKQGPPSYLRALRINTDPRPAVKVLLLSYSSEMFKADVFRNLVMLEHGLLWEQVQRKKIDYIVVDAFTHKNKELETPPPEIKIEKINYMNSGYLLYIIHRNKENIKRYESVINSKTFKER